MAGHIISLYFKERGHDVTGFTRRPIDYCKNIIGDAMSVSDIKAALESDTYDVVINNVTVNDFGYAINTAVTSAARARDRTQAHRPHGSEYSC